MNLYRFDEFPDIVAAHDPTEAAAFFINISFSHYEEWLDDVTPIQIRETEETKWLFEILESDFQRGIWGYNDDRPYRFMVDRP